MFPNVIWECRFSVQPVVRIQLLLSPIPALPKTKRSKRPTIIHKQHNNVFCFASSHAESNTKHKQEGSIYLEHIHTPWLSIPTKDARSQNTHRSTHHRTPYLSLIVLMRILLCCATKQIIPNAASTNVYSGKKICEALAVYTLQSHYACCDKQISIMWVEVKTRMTFEIFVSTFIRRVFDQNWFVLHVCESDELIWSWWHIEFIWQEILVKECVED